MKRVINTAGRRIGLVLLAALPLAAQNALAVGTPAGTTVQNSVTASYSVGGVPQTDVTSAPVTFEVDQRVDFTLVEVGSAATTVTPGQNNAVTTFELTNLGNASQDFDLAAINLSGGSVHGNPDSVDVEDPPRVFVDANDNGTYEAGTDTAIFVDELTGDDSAGANVITVFVVANVGTVGIGNGDFANVQLTATAHDAGAAGLGAQTTDDSGDVDDPDVVQIVFADSGNDGAESAEDGYAIESAALEVIKSNAVVRDDLGSANPKLIPGAVVEYAITITNTGPVAAQSVGIVDDNLDANLTLLLGDYGGAGDDAQYQVGAGPASTCTLDGDDLDGDGCGSFAGGTEVRVIPGGGLGLGDVSTAPDNQAVIRFRMTID